MKNIINLEAYREVKDILEGWELLESQMDKAEIEKAKEEGRKLVEELYNEITKRRTDT